MQKRILNFTLAFWGLFLVLFAMPSALFAQGDRILIVSGHSNIDSSVATKTIIDEIKQEFPQAATLYLDKEYPNFQIDVQKERERVLGADIIVFAYPIYWYAPPAIMKRYQDEVFVFGFAHDAKGGLLGGKILLLSATSGAPEAHYHLGARMNYPMEMLQIPLQQFANLYGMKFGGLVYSGDYNLGRKEAEKDKQIAQAKAYAQNLKAKIKELISQK